MAQLLLSLIQSHYSSIQINSATSVGSSQFPVKFHGRTLSRGITMVRQNSCCTPFSCTLWAVWAQKGPPVAEMRAHLACEVGDPRAENTGGPRDSFWKTNPFLIENGIEKALLENQMKLLWQDVRQAWVVTSVGWVVTSCLGFHQQYLHVYPRDCAGSTISNLLFGLVLLAKTVQGDYLDLLKGP